MFDPKNGKNSIAFRSRLIANYCPKIHSSETFAVRAQYNIWHSAPLPVLCRRCGRTPQLEPCVFNIGCLSHYNSCALLLLLFMAKKELYNRFPIDWRSLSLEMIPRGIGMNTSQGSLSPFASNLYAIIV